MSRRRLAVMFVHGVEVADPDFAATAMRLLGEEFTRIAGVEADEALVMEPGFWAPEYEQRQDQLLQRMGGGPAQQVFDVLDRLAGAADRGSSLALLAMIASGVVRSLPGVPQFHFPTLRWLIVHYLGDALSYQAGPVDRDLYDGVHRRLARAVHTLAAEAGPDAPLCVVAHSLGTVVSSNFFYDLQAGQDLHPGRQTPIAVAPMVAAELGDTPMERGETLAWFHTLGSPLALWAQRHPDFGEPQTVPHPALAGLHPRVEGGWSNVWDPDDVIASPLRTLNERYGAAVTEDRAVAVAPWWLGWSPLAHPFYWNDLRVVTPIATSLARAGTAWSTERLPRGRVPMRTGAQSPPTRSHTAVSGGRTVAPSAAAAGGSLASSTSPGTGSATPTPERLTTATNDPPRENARTPAGTGARPPSSPAPSSPSHVRSSPSSAGRRRRSARVAR